MSSVNWPSADEVVPGSFTQYDTGFSYFHVDGSVHIVGYRVDDVNPGQNESEAHTSNSNSDSNGKVLIHRSYEGGVGGGEQSYMNFYSDGSSEYIIASNFLPHDGYLTKPTIVSHAPEADAPPPPPDPDDNTNTGDDPSQDSNSGGEDFVIHEGGQYAIQINVFTDSLSGHVNVTLVDTTTGLKAIKTIGANQEWDFFSQGLGALLTKNQVETQRIGGERIRKELVLEGVIVDEGDVNGGPIREPSVTALVPITGQQLKDIGTRLGEDELLNSRFDYAVVGAAEHIQTCAEFVQQIFAQTGHGGEFGELFSVQDRMDNPSAVWEYIVGAPTSAEVAGAEFTQLPGDEKRVIEEPNADYVVDPAQIGFAESPPPGSSGGSSQTANPVILDLDNDGIEFLADPIAAFDMDNDGFLEATHWVSPDDAYLVVDLNADGSRGAGDGLIDQTAELVLTEFAGLTSGTDLQALDNFDRLAEFGGNNDGFLSDQDAIWTELRVWQDGNSNGVVETGELKTLTELGFSQFSLSYDDGTDYADASNDSSLFGSVLYGRASYVRNGETVIGGVGDMALSYHAVGIRLVDTSNGFGIEFEDGSVANSFVSLDGLASPDLDLAASGVVAVAGDARDNALSAVGSASEVVIEGGGGDDIITGGLGSDYLFGGDGDDSIDGGAGNDLIAGGIGSDVLSGGAGNNRFSYTSVSEAGDVISDFDPTKDQLDLRELVASLGEKPAASYIALVKGEDGVQVRVDPSAELPTGGTVLLTLQGADITALTIGENVLLGGIEDKRLRPSDNTDVATTTYIPGGDGDDTLYGDQDGAAADFLNGKVGDDTMIGKLYNEKYIVDSSGDVIVEQAHEGLDVIELWTRDFDMSANAANVEMMEIKRSSGSNVIGNDSDNTIKGHTGVDTIDGGAGDDLLIGNEGDDILSGGLGRDWLIGGLGIDVLTGGAGSDVIVIDAASEGGDRVTDFLIGEDAVDLRVLMDELVSGVAVADAVSITDENGDAVIGFDADGDGAGNSVEIVRLEGVDATNLTFETDIWTDLSGLTPANVDTSETNDPPPDDAPEPDPDNTPSSKSNTARTLPDEVDINWGNRIDGTSSADSLTGGSDDDYINGKGGDDVMTGLAGNDVYNLYQDGDQVIEAAGEGIDMVLAGIDYALHDNVEQARVNSSSGRQITGNDLDNRLEGNTGDDELIGGIGQDWLIGRDGADTLTGGQDADVFVYTSSGEGGDEITDFQVGIDSVDLRQLNVSAGDVTVSAVDTTGDGANDATQLTVSINGSNEVLATFNGVANSDELEIGYDLWVA